MVKTDSQNVVSSKWGGKMLLATIVRMEQEYKGITLALTHSLTHSLRFYTLINPLKKVINYFCVRMEMRRILSARRGMTLPCLTRIINRMEHMRPRVCSISASTGAPSQCTHEIRCGEQFGLYISISLSLIQRRG